MYKLSDFKPLVQGKPLQYIRRVHKQASLNLTDFHSLQSSIRTNSTSLLTCFPGSRKASKNPKSLSKIVSDKKILKKAVVSAPLAFEDQPNLPKKTFHNERIYWKKRKLGNLPILLIVSEGVLSCYARECLWSDEKASFRLRENFNKGLSRLKNEFYLILVSTYQRYATKELIGLVNVKQNIFDAVYIQRHRKWHARHVHDIEAILKDFNADANNVLAVSAIGIDTDEILERGEKELIRESTSSFSRKYLTYFSPSCEKEAPVTVLIPHLGLDNKYQSFLDLAEFLLKVKNTEKNLFEGFEKIHCLKAKLMFNDGCKSTSSLPLHRFLIYCKERFNQIKPSTSNMMARKPRRIIF